MMEIALSPDLIAVGDHRLEGGMRALIELNNSGVQPTAVLCSNDMTAIGVMRQAYDQNIRVPESLSVVGFDDIRLAEFTTPPLTTVQMSQKELAKMAFRALLNEIECDPPSHERHEYELTTSLVLRRSTALAPAGGSAISPKGVRRSRSRNATGTLPP